jgi:ACR3 family arsenite transporter
MIRGGLRALKQNLIYVVILSLAAGIVAGQFIGSGTRSLLQSAVTPVLFLMIYPMMINIDLREIFNIREHLGPVGLSLVVNFAAVPLLAVGLAELFFAGNAAYAVGLYLIALIPT